MKKRKLSDSGKSTCKKKKTEKTEEQLLREEELKQKRKEHEKSIKEAREQNKKNNKRGDVQCDKQPHFRAPKHVSKVWPTKKGYKNISVCSNARGIWRQLSPMILGPIIYKYGNEEYEVTNLENLWQFSKVWEGDTDKNGLPNKEWYERRAKGWRDQKAHRRVKGKGNITLYSYYKGEKLNYIEARKKIYCVEYAKLAVKTEAFKKLQEMLDDGYNINIIGYDGYDISGKTLKECLNDKTRPFGHELVLVSLLRGERPWEE